MKKVVISLLCVLITVSAFGQSLDLSQIELSDLDLTQADLSEAKLYFAGPVDLLIRGVKYMGSEFTALLKYDGLGTVEIDVPANPSAAVPYALDLSEVQLSLVADGILMSNVIADGRYFSGKLVPTGDLNLAVAPGITIGGVAGIADLSDDVNELRSDISTLRRQLASAESAADAAEGELAAAERAADAAEREVAAAERAADTAEGELADAETQIASLQSRLERAGGGAVDPREVVAAVTRSVKSGFGGGGSLAGSWSLSGSSLRQSSAVDLFAKYTVPVNQNANELVYTFGGTGSATGWSGYGIHILASGSSDGELYGFGSSYLVWVTRDIDATQTEQTFIQLYRSYDDVHMVQLASQAIAGSISSPIDVTVYVNRSDGLIVLGVGDEAIVSYEDSSIIRSGTSVVARTLGPATISGLSVKSR